MSDGPLRNRVVLHQRDREAIAAALRASCAALKARWSEDSEPPDESFEAALNGDALTAVLGFLGALPPDGVSAMFIGRGGLRLVRPLELEAAVEKVALLFMDDFDADPLWALPGLLGDNPELPIEKEPGA